jgi:hypothetical protein
MAASALGSALRLHGGRATGAEPRLVTAALISGMRKADIAVHERKVRGDDVALRHTAAHRARGGIIALFDAAEQFEVTAVLAGEIVDGHAKVDGPWLIVDSLRAGKGCDVEGAPRIGLWSSRELMGVGLF